MTATSADARAQPGTPAEHETTDDLRKHRWGRGRVAHVLCGGGDYPVLVHNIGPCDLASSIADHSIARLRAGASDHLVAGIQGREALAQYVDDILFDVRPSISKPLRDGRVAYWDDQKGAVMIENPLAGEPGYEGQEFGSVFTPEIGRQYYDDLR